MVARDAMTINNRSLSTAMERLSTGKRINSAADDAAGLSIGTRMDAQVRGLNMAIKNANDAISVTQTAEGAMQEVTSILQRMRELSVQSSSDTNSAEDRAFLQQEVSQLSSEIDRISTTTQFNGINVLDGTFKGKIFQIGANQGQTMGLSIGSLKSSVLGVASGNTAVSTTGASAASTISDAAAKGVAATATVVKLGFSASDTYTFTLADDVSGLTGAGVTAKALDLTSTVSKRDFADKINKELKEAAQNTVLTGSATVAATTDITDADNYADLKFSVSINGGTPVNSIDLRSRLLTSALNINAVTDEEIATAMTNELQALYDDSISVKLDGAGGTSGKAVITDKQGRKIEVSQGAGSGAIFGTDVENVGALKVEANVQSNLSVAWSGNDLVVTNKAGGKTTLAAFDTVATTTKVTFDAVTDAQANQRDPIVLAKAVSSDDAVSIKGRTEATGIQMTFSDRTGDGTNAKYEFKLTNGAGDIYADLTGVNALNVKSTATDAEVVAAFKARLTAIIADDGILKLAAAGDGTINADEFDVTFKDNVLTVTNSAGRSLAVEKFASTDGYMVVTPTNELGSAKTLSSETALYSELNLKINTSSFGVDLTDGTTDPGKFDIWIDGAKSAGGFELADLDGVGDNTSGTTLAQALETAISALTDVTNTDTGMKLDVSGITAKWDSNTGTIAIRDIKGRSISIAAQGTNSLAGMGAVLTNDGGTTPGNNNLRVQTASSIAKGDVIQAAEVKFSLSENNSKFDFKLNGQNLFAAGLTWDSTKALEGSDLKKNLDALMTTLNNSHPTPVFEYKVSGNEITFFQRAGGELKISDFKTFTGGDAITATITPVNGQGAAKTVGYNEVVATANASGTKATATTATLKLTGDDLYSLSVSDGKNIYTMAPTTVDLLDANSTRKFVDNLNSAMGGSSIKASMDTKGNLYLTDSAGGDVALTSFSSATGKTATWTPKQGQGNSLTLTGSGAVSFSGEVPAGGSVFATPSAGSSVSQISIATQDGATKALKVIDSALSYVNNERSKLGAVENRLTHTIDNLTNVVTNTAASKSRIVDTDYATETTELARAQIIQQAATAMLAQANQSAQGVLSLLK